jgi:hypothetical protein
MEAKLGIATCDKCQKPMTESQSVLIITEGNITKSDDALTFDGSCVRYACHRDCWDAIAQID